MQGNTDESVKKRTYNLTYKAKHKERIKQQRVGYRAKNAHTIARQIREKKYKYRYGITIAQYDLMLGLQEGLCAICETPMDATKGKRLGVDHDHETGKVRGLLCVLCNQALGMFQDSPAVLNAAIQYLKEHGKR